MARPTKEENKDNPLKKLRRALGDGDISMPQHRLAKFLGVPLETIKAIESGKRQRAGLSNAIVYHAYSNLGASWSEADQSWTPVGTRDPLDLAHVKRWRRATFVRDNETDAMLLRLMVVLDSAPEKKFKEIVDAVEVKLQELLQEFDYQPEYQDADWRDTQLAFIALGKGGYVRTRSTNMDEERELFDFRDRRKNSKRNYPATRNKIT
jgi:DNA-binding XRE family transcriptional regulator